MHSETWICDKCKEPIKKVEDGYLEWIRDIKTDEISEFKILHNQTCLRDEMDFHNHGYTLPGNHLKYYTGENGQVKLLEILSQNNLKNKNEVLTIFQRIHISGYEKARFYFDDALSDGLIDSPKNDVFYLYDKQIAEINSKYY